MSIQAPSPLSTNKKKILGLVWLEGWKSGRIENGERMKKWEDRIIFILSLLFGWKWKSGRMKKISLNKFTHIPLLKNDAQLKQKKWQITTKKEQSPKFIKKIKIMSQKNK